MRTGNLYARNLRAARRAWGPRLQKSVAKTLKCLSDDLRVDIASGDLLLLNDHWYVTHAGLLRVARRRRCSGINVEAVAALCDPTASRYVCKATVYSSKNCSGFAGLGDADPSNVSPLVYGAEMRVAETRAVNRATTTVVFVRKNCQALAISDRFGQAQRPGPEAYLREALSHFRNPPAALIERLLHCGIRNLHERFDD
jgi:hypothetical protein